MRPLRPAGRSTLFATALLLAAPGSAIDTPVPVAVQVRALDGEHLPGAVVYLCQGPCPGHPEENWKQRCRVQVTDVDGIAHFEVPSQGSFGFTAELEGFAKTTVYPLSFGPDASPRAPGELTVVLNPVCFHC
jgi:hypothetical protein